MFNPLYTKEELELMNAEFQRWVSWGLYGLGDLASRILDLHAADTDPYSELWCDFWYPVYNKLMCWSLSVQGETENGPWRAVSNEEEDSSPEQDQQS